MDKSNTQLEKELNLLRAKELQILNAQMLIDKDKARAKDLLLSIRLQFSHTFPSDSKK